MKKPLLLVFAVSTAALNLGCAETPKNNYKQVACGSGTLFYGVRQSKTLSTAWLTQMGMTAAESSQTSVDWRFDDGTGYPKLRLMRSGESFEHQLGMGNAATVRCPGGVVHNFATADTRDGLASQKAMFSAVQSFGQATQSMQDQADAKKEEQRKLYSNIPPLAKPAAPAANQGSSNTSSNPGETARAKVATTVSPGTSAGANGAAPAVAAAVKPATSTLEKSAAAASLTTGSSPTPNGGGNAGVAANKSGSSDARPTSTSKPSGPGVLIVDDKAFKAEEKRKQESAGALKSAEADAAAKRAKYLEESAKLDAEVKARIEEEQRKRRALGNRQ